MTDRHTSLVDTRPWPPSLRWLVIGAAMLVLCSCQSSRPVFPVPGSARLSPLRGGQPVPAVQASRMPAAPPSAVVAVGDLPPSTSAGPVALAAQRSPVPSQVVPAAAMSGQVPSPYGGARGSYPCEAAGVAPATWSPSGLRKPWPPDEYLCDGGDGQIMATVGANLKINGLEPEDAVLHFDTLDGRTVIEPTNRVCIYAPRFAAVRKVTGVVQNERHQHVLRVDGEAVPIGVDDVQIPNKVNQPLGPQRQVGTKLANSLDEHLVGGGLDNAQRLVQERDGALPHEDVATLRKGELDDTDQAELAAGVDAALAWTRVQAVQLVIDGQPAVADVLYDAPHVVYQYKLAGKPRIRVIKLASTGTAQPGELVDLTIHFENVGTQKVNRVTIVDNLTPRLEYVPATQQCSLQADFSSQANEGDSLVLRWDIRDPLLPGKKGTIRFRCRVR